MNQKPCSHPLIRLGLSKQNNIDHFGLSNMLVKFGPQYLVSDIHQDYGSSIAW